MKYWVICSWSLCSVWVSQESWATVFQNPPVTGWQTGFIFIKCCFSEKQSYYVTLKSTYLMLCPTVFLGVFLWIILQLLPQALVYDKWNHAVTLVLSIYYSCFVLKIEIANWSMLYLVALLLLKRCCTSADCISFHFQEQLPFPICLVSTKGLTSQAGCAHCSALTSLGLWKPGKREGRTPELILLQDKSCTINVECLWKQQSPGEWCEQV